MKFLADPCGVICFVLIYASVVYVDYSISGYIILPVFNGSLWGTFHVVFFNTLVFMLVFSHFKASFSDPGHVPFPEVAVDFSESRRSSRKKRSSSTDDWTTCKYCELFRPPRAHHCRVCRRCINKMDHHCPWINNCVGEWNQKYFLLFLLYTGISCMYGLILILSNWNNSVYKTTRKSRERETRRLHLIMTMILCGLYAVFSLCIMIDQLRSIFTDTTAVESVQKRETKYSKSKMALLSEVFGGGSRLRWFLPCSSPRLGLDYINSYTV